MNGNGYTYQVTISIDSDTQNWLRNSGFTLYAFKAVAGKNGQPTVWFTSNAFLDNVQVQWSENIQGYISNTVVQPNVVIQASTMKAISLGQTWQVASDESSTIVSKGQSGAVTFHSEYSGSSLACGLCAQTANGDPTPYCAFDLEGGISVQLTPIEKVAFILATDSINTGTVIEQAFSDGILIDMTSNNTQSLKYVKGQGWVHSDDASFTDISDGDSLRAMLVSSNV